MFTNWLPHPAGRDTIPYRDLSRGDPRLRDDARPDRREDDAHHEQRPTLRPLRRHPRRGPLRAPLAKLPEAGQLVASEDFLIGSGGCAANTSATLARLGVAARVTGKVGEDIYGTFITQDLASKGVETSGISRSDKHGTSKTVHPACHRRGSPLHPHLRRQRRLRRQRHRSRRPGRRAHLLRRRLPGAARPRPGRSRRSCSASPASAASAPC